MKIIFSLLLTCFFGSFTFSQSNYSLVDAKILGSTGSDKTEAIKVDDNGNIYVLASTSLNINNNDMSINHYGGFDVWLLKLDSDKNIIWQKSYGGSDFDKGAGVNILPNGNVLLFINSDSSPSGNRTAPKKGSGQDIWILEADKNNGNIIQQKSAGGDSRDFYADSKLRSNGDIVLLSGTNDTGVNSFDVAEPPFNTDSITTDPWVAVLDAQLNIVSQKRIIQGSFNGGGGSGFGSLLLTDDFLYVASSSNGNSGGFKSDSSFNSTTITYPNYDCWLIKMDWNFNKVWDKTFGGFEDDVVNGISKTNNNKLIIGISSKSGVTGNKSSSKIGMSYNIWMIKVDEDGDKIEDKTFGNSGGVGIETEIINIGANQFLFGGFIAPLNDNDFSNTQFYGGFNDGYLMTIDNNLDKIDFTAFGTPEDEGIASLFYKNGMIITGGASNYSGTTTYHPTNGIGSYDLWLLELSTSLSTSKEEIGDVSIFPNPTQQMLHIKNTDNMISSFSVYNPLGKRVFAQNDMNNHTFQINVQDFDTGVYFLNLKFKNGNSTSKKFVVE